MQKIPYIATNGSDESLSRFPDWRETLAILMERAWLGLLVAAIVFLAFFFHARRQTPMYRSSTTLLVEAQIPKILNFQDVLSYNTRSAEYFNTHLNALHSRNMMMAALERSGLARRADFLPDQLSLEEKAEATRRLVTIRAVEKTRMIEIVVEYSDPQIGSDLANALAQAYIQQYLNMRMNASLEAVEWLRERSEEYREKLEKGLSQLQEYREKTGSVSLEEDQNIVIEKLKALNAALTVAETERMQAETLWKSVQAQQEAGTPANKIAAILNEASVQAALQQWRDQQREVARLRQRYREQYPDLQQAIEHERRLQKQFEETCEDALHALKSRYEILRQREESLRAALQEQEKEAFELDRKLVRYNELKLNVEADREIHQAVISRMKEASIAETLPVDLIRVVEEARPAKVPFRPRMGQAALRGLLFGLLLGIGSIFLFYYADHRLRRNEEVERVLGMPVMATIPLIGEKGIRERGLISHLQQTGEVAEAFRTLRASLLLKEEVRNAPVLMVTSAGPEEGKSLVAINLAISLAQDGRPTLLLAADLRRPALNRIFGWDTETLGLADILKGSLRWTDVLQPQPVPNLAVITSGRIPPNPAELLGRNSFKEFLEEARKTYRHIVVDSPPVLGVSDTLVLLPQMDGVLFVVRYAVTHSLAASQALLKIQAGGTPCLGCIMNGVNFRSMTNYYYYRRYGGFTYSYYRSSPQGTTA